MRTTTYIPLQPSAGSFSQRLWRQLRDNPLLAWGSSAFALALCAYCVFYEVTFMLTLPPALALLACCVNLIDLTTRLYDQDRKWQGLSLMLWTGCTALSLAPTYFYLFLSWLFLVG